jgi:hypothetical protein
MVNGRTKIIRSGDKHVGAIGMIRMRVVDNNSMAFGLYAWLSTLV